MVESDFKSSVAEMYLVKFIRCEFCCLLVNLAEGLCCPPLHLPVRPLYIVSTIDS